jgi:hypothetical protein
MGLWGNSKARHDAETQGGEIGKRLKLWWKTVRTGEVPITKSCVGCTRAIPYTARVCEFCHTVQP